MTKPVEPTPTPAAKKNVDVLVFETEDGEQFEVEVEAGTIDFLTREAEKAGEPLERFILNIISDYANEVLSENRKDEAESAPAEQES